MKRLIQKDCIEVVFLSKQPSFLYHHFLKILCVGFFSSSQQIAPLIENVAIYLIDLIFWWNEKYKDCTDAMCDLMQSLLSWRSPLW